MSTPKDKVRAGETPTPARERRVRSPFRNFLKFRVGFFWRRAFIPVAPNIKIISLATR